MCLFQNFIPRRGSVRWPLAVSTRLRKPARGVLVRAPGGNKNVSYEGCTRSFTCMLNPFVPKYLGLKLHFSLQPRLSIAAALPLPDIPPPSPLPKPQHPEARKAQQSCFRTHQTEFKVPIS